MPVDPTFLAQGADWAVPSVGAGPEPTPGSGGGFGEALVGQINKLSELQTDAAGQAQSLAAGTTNDPTAAVMAVERARLAMQLASQLRNKAVEAVQDIFHTQV